MMIPRRSSHSKAFTLIEILVVAALISIIAGIATLNWRVMMENAKKKTTYADARTLAHALSTVQMDIGIFPKIGFLYEPKEVFALTYGANNLPPHFEALGHPNSALGPASRGILSKWAGPYYTNPSGRGGFSPGNTGGVVDMELPDGKIVKWPADPWDNPYVVYLINIETGGPPSNPTISITWIKNPYEEPNYRAMVVSYGPNHVPGGSSDRVKNAPFMIDAAKYKLYTEVNRKHYKALTYSELSGTTPVNRLLALSSDPTGNFKYLGPGFPGITDDESDDIYIVIP